MYTVVVCAAFLAARWVVVKTPGAEHFSGAFFVIYFGLAMLGSFVLQGRRVSPLRLRRNAHIHAYELRWGEYGRETPAGAADKVGAIAGAIGGWKVDLAVAGVTALADAIFDKRSAEQRELASAISSLDVEIRVHDAFALTGRVVMILFGALVLLITSV
jgi:hypothetical protein